MSKTILAGAVVASALLALPLAASADSGHGHKAESTSSGGHHGDEEKTSTTQPADLAGGRVVAKATAGEKAPGHAFERHDRGLAHQDRAAGENIRVRPQCGRKIARSGGQEMMWGDRRHPAEPEVRQLGQDLALARDAGPQDVVVGRDPVGGDDQQLVSQVVDIADLAPPRRR